MRVVKKYIYGGWKSIREQFYVVIILFLYQLLWGYFLYRFVQSALVPILMRYPDPAPNNQSQLLFYVEGQMNLTESSTVHYYLWMLLGMLVFRMLLTPLIHAGILHGLHQEREGSRGLFFFRGIKQLWKPVLLFYIIEILLIAAPAYWIIPKMMNIGLAALQFREIGVIVPAIPYVLLWLFYAYLVHQLLLYLLFAKTGKRQLLSSLLLCLRHSLSVISISLLLGGVSLVLFGLSTGISLLWTGLFGLILQQAHHFISCILKMWHITAQYQLWNDKLMQKNN